MANIVTGITGGVKFIIENPIWAMAIIIGILLMPLEVLDLLLYIFVNLIIIFINLIIFILYMLFNAIVWIVNGIITAIFGLFSTVGLTGDPPQLNDLDYVSQAYITVDLFSPDKNLLLLLLDLFGRTLPLW